MRGLDERRWGQVQYFYHFANDSEAARRSAEMVKILDLTPRRVHLQPLSMTQ